MHHLFKMPFLKNSLYIIIITIFRGLKLKKNCFQVVVFVRYFRAQAFHRLLRAGKIITLNTILIKIHPLNGIREEMAQQEISKHRKDRLSIEFQSGKK